MKLAKAIETLKAENRRPWNHAGSDLREAVKLSIEALKEKLEREERGTK